MLSREIGVSCTASGAFTAFLSPVNCLLSTRSDSAIKGPEWLKFPGAIRTGTLKTQCWFSSPSTRRPRGTFDPSPPTFAAPDLAAHHWPELCQPGPVAWTSASSLPTCLSRPVLLPTSRAAQPAKRDLAQYHLALCFIRLAKMVED